ncbi:hypothetical protein CERSUDRAFT_57638 [Gelatoporia subvermispora B]|uniref:DH domain-containing protein n=1 Tax=Ceriporiopsis subvermispora (strain B) TaxID=914234 RepID=M2R270_CERS8|nr:hypothetical protein CERSUDRAFT_57638 [Gelatoporia subvermispora B]
MTPGPDKPLPPSPHTPLSSVENDRRDSNSRDTLEEDDELHSSPRSSILRTPAVVSKRTHALLELLSSERSYASDLALIRDIHIPLALGQPAPFQTSVETPPSSSSSSSRTLSTASDSSGGSNGAPSLPPMTREDVRIIFNNVAELAVFADGFSEKLEEALGGVLEGGSGEDHVGTLFLEVIPQLESLYEAYITRHSTALEHLNNLPQSPALTTYLTQTRTLASSLSHAWDLPSLLIKPVQRLLKYPLLLATIIEETPNTHADKANLRRAREKMEEVARGVNEGRRRREVVKEVLTGGSPGRLASEQKPKKKGLNIGIAASVSLGRMKSMRSVSAKAKEGAEASQEVDQVKKLGEELLQSDIFIRTFAKGALDWASEAHRATERLRNWAMSFGRVIWMGTHNDSEAFEAFLGMVQVDLPRICEETTHIIKDELLVQLQRLVESSLAPSRLVEAMQTLEPLHVGLLNLNVSKSRPPPQLLEASQSYIALRGQLASELPLYLPLLYRGLMFVVLRFAHVQAEFFGRMFDHWNRLWEALKEEGETNDGAEATLQAWWLRFGPIAESISNLTLVQPPEKLMAQFRTRQRPRQIDRLDSQATVRQSDRHTQVDPRANVRSFHSDTTLVNTGSAVSSILSSLDPSDKRHESSGPQKPSSPPVSKTKSRSMHSFDYGPHTQRTVERRTSRESLQLQPKKPSRPRTITHRSIDENALENLDPIPSHSTYRQVKSRPLSPLSLKKSQSQGRLMDMHDNFSINSSTPSLISMSSTTTRADSSSADDSTIRGRTTRKPSLRRRLTDSLRPSPTSSTSRHRRSPSLPSMKSLNILPSPTPSPSKSSFTSGTAHSGKLSFSGGRIPALYSCRVIHPCEPPPGVAYRDVPFMTLVVDDIYDILQEAGHPSTHADLPLYMDEGEDCLLLVRNAEGDIGWALASFMVPVE